MCIPYYENCHHSEEGWCLGCVKELGEELMQIQKGEWRKKQAAEKESKVMLLAVEHYGAKNQAAQLMGEMGELAAVLTRHFFQSRDRKKEIAEEIADVQIMLEQMILHLGIEKEVAECRANKLKRLESRINQAG